MCDIHAFVAKDGEKKKVLESVKSVKSNGDEVSLMNIFGEEKTIRATFNSFDQNSRMILFDAV